MFVVTKSILYIFSSNFSCATVFHSDLVETVIRLLKIVKIVCFFILQLQHPCSKKLSHKNSEFFWGRQTSKCLVIRKPSPIIESKIMIKFSVYVP